MGGGNDLLIILNTVSDGLGGFAGRYVDGGSGTDTVWASDLTETIFRNVEVLRFVSVTGTVKQLLAFSSFEEDFSAEGKHLVYLRGEGGAIDFSTRMASTWLDLSAANATSSVEVKGTVNADHLIGSSFDDTLEGLGGSDVFTVSQGSDVLKGGAGRDVFQISSDASGSIDGGAGIDTVEAVNLGTISFSSVENLIVTGLELNGRIVQVGAFSSIVFSADSTASAFIGLQGAGGVIDFSTALGNRPLSLSGSALTSASRRLARETMIRSAGPCLEIF